MGYITNRTRIEPTVSNKRKLLLLLASGLLCWLIALLTFLVDPLMLIITYYSQVTNGSYVHELFTREIHGIHVSVYLFNITNPKEFLSGEDHKLKVEEVGPFTYQENRIYSNLELDSNAKVIRYTPKVEVVFLPEESIGRPEDVTVTMPNLAMLSVASKVSEFSYFPRMGFNLMTYKYRSQPIVSMNVNDYLWGYDEPIIKLGNTVIPEIVNFDMLGIMDRLYDKKAIYNFEVSTNDEDKFMIKSMNGVKGLEMWGYEDPDSRSPCNSFTNAYEGIAYPPNLDPKKPIKLYRNIICRFLEFEFIEKRTMEYGAEGLFYKISNRTFAVNNDTKCLCSRGVCYEGIWDLAPCLLGLPLVLSNAHFMHADPKLYERVEGMNPNEEQHGSGFTIDTKTGVVLTTQFSVQVNILVRDVKFNSETSKFSDMIVPVGYFKIVQPPITDEQIWNLKFVFIYGPYSVIFLQTLLVFTGLILLAFAVRILYGSLSYSGKKSIFLVKVDHKSSVERPLMS